MGASNKWAKFFNKFDYPEEISQDTFGKGNGLFFDLLVVKLYFPVHTHVLSYMITHSKQNIVK